MARVNKKVKKKRGPPEPPPLVIETDDPLGAFDRMLKADPNKAKAEARKPRRK
jgi:hypothetical protein